MNLSLELYQACKKLNIETHTFLSESIRPVGLLKKGGLYRKLMKISKEHNVAPTDWQCKISNEKSTQDFRALIFTCKKIKSIEELKLLYKEKTGYDYVPNPKFNRPTNPE